MNIKKVYILDDRAILYINGEDAKEFLQNLISNDINKVSDVNSCFSSLLTPQGKFLYEFIIVKHKSGYLVDCEKLQAEELFKQLTLYNESKKHVFLTFWCGRRDSNSLGHYPFPTNHNTFSKSRL